jgi:hypothetical protein
MSFAPDGNGEFSSAILIAPFETRDTDRKLYRDLIGLALLCLIGGVLARMSTTFGVHHALVLS